MDVFRFPCVSFEFMNIQNQHTDKIIVPDTILVEWLFNEPNLLEGGNLIQLELTNPINGKKTHCGIKEFKDYPNIIMPNWMMTNLGLREGDNVDFQKIVLPLATTVVFEPDTPDFNMDIKNPEEVLADNLSHNFSCLTVGDRVPIYYQEKQYIVNVIRLEPQPAVSLINPATMEMEAVLEIEASKRQKQIYQYKQQQKRIRFDFLRSGQPKAVLDALLIDLSKKYNYYPQLEEHKSALLRMKKLLQKRPGDPTILRLIANLEKNIQQQSAKIQKIISQQQPKQKQEQDRMSVMLRMKQNMQKSIREPNVQQKKAFMMNVLKQKFPEQFEKAFGVVVDPVAPAVQPPVPLAQPYPQPQQQQWKVELKQKLRAKYPNIHNRELEIAMCVRPTAQELDMYPDFLKWIQRELRTYRR
jgi:Ubiquitin fusion degradation protein UFD1